MHNCYIRFGRAEKIGLFSVFSISSTAVFFQLFNFKMKFFPILGHLYIVSDRELEKASF